MSSLGGMIKEISDFPLAVSRVLIILNKFEFSFAIFSGSFTFVFFACFLCSLGTCSPATFWSDAIPALCPPARRSLEYAGVTAATRWTWGPTVTLSRYSGWITCTTPGTSWLGVLERMVSWVRMVSLVLSRGFPYRWLVLERMVSSVEVLVRLVN